jgi:CBS domain-containing protein
LGLLAESEQGEREAVMATLDQKRVQDIMTAPAVSIQDDRLLTEAVDVMMTKKLKRLPVVDKGGRLVGILSRLDIFKTVMREAPNWDAFRAQQIDVSNLHTVKGILRRDTRTVSPDTTIDKVLQIIDGNDIQCVAVVNSNGTLIGMIADSDLLHYFKPDPEGFRVLFSRLIRSADRDLVQRLGTTTASDVMCADLLTVHEDMLIEDVIRLMTEKRLKRLPVIDDASRFKGMINRDSLLRTGYGRLS